jgi:hypothetical protein
LKAMIVPVVNASAASPINSQQIVRMAAIIIPRMKHTALIIALALTTSIAFVAQAQGPRRDGRWEVKVEMDMPGMPQGMPPMTSTQCITPEEAKDPQKAMPQGGRGGRGGTSDCKVSDYKVDGNKVSWSMACPAQQMSGTGEFVYAGDTYTGTMKMDRGGQAMTMKYSAKRLGDCTK